MLLISPMMKIPKNKMSKLLFGSVHELKNQTEWSHLSPAQDRDFQQAV